MLKTQITGAKYLSPQTNQMTNLNIAVPADSKDTEFGTSDILLAKDTVKIINDKIANKKSFKFVETLPNKIEDVDPDVIYIVTGINTDTKNVKIINKISIGNLVNNEDTYYEYVFLKYEDKRLYYEQLGKSNKLPLAKGNNETSVATIRSTANGNFSTALGMGCTTNNAGECAVGYFNMSTESDNPSKKTLFSVGNGQRGFKNNAFEVRANGDVYMGLGSLDPDGGMEPFKLQEYISRIDEIYNNMHNMFEVVTELPNVRDAETSKIYCIKDPTSTDDQNVYVEYAIVEGEDGYYHFEKIGQFKAEPDLSGYAQLSGAKFTGNIVIKGGCEPNMLRTFNIGKAPNGKFLYLNGDDSLNSATKTYLTNGDIGEIGPEESFVFTLEDGSTVTKSIRVIKTTTTPTT